jgi:hypothetical protein
MVDRTLGAMLAATFWLLAMIMLVRAVIRMRSKGRR